MVIALSKLDGSTMYVNEDHVERVEAGVTSAVHLSNGTYLIVRDDADTIIERIRAEKASVLARAMVSLQDGSPVATLRSVPTAPPSDRGGGA
jgi:uncharacterized protein YlzI (FlbEa/FlbD family)